MASVSLPLVDSEITRIEITDTEPLKVVGDLRWTGKARFPGSPRGRSIVIFQFDDELMAIPAFCPHEQANLAEAIFVAPYVLECPLHQNHYDLRTGVIKAFRVEMDDDKLFLLWNRSQNAGVVPNFSAETNVGQRTEDERVSTLQREVDSLTEAGKIRERHMIETIQQMDGMVAEVEEKRAAIERTNSELALMNEFVSRVTNTMSEVLLVLDTHGKVKQVNRRALELLGYAESEVVGHTCDQLISPGDLETLRKSLKHPAASVAFAAFAQHVQAEFDVELVSRGGEKLEHLLRTALLFGAAGKKEGVVVVGTDIRQIKAAQRELGAAYAKVSGLLHNMRQAVFVVVASGEIIEPASEYSRAVFGRDVVGANVFDVVFRDLDRGSETFSSLNLAFLTTFDSDDLQWELMADYFPRRVLLHRDGAEGAESEARILKVDYCPLRNEEGLMDKMMLVVEDITRLERLEEEMAREKAASQRRIEMVEELTRIKPADVSAFLSEANRFLLECREIVARPTLEAEARVLLFRTLHTLKGNARMLGFRRIGEATHEAENEIAPYRATAHLDDEARSRVRQALSTIQRETAECSALAAQLLRIPNEFEGQTLSALHAAAQDLDRRAIAWIGAPALLAADLASDALVSKIREFGRSGIREAVHAVAHANEPLACPHVDRALRDFETSAFEMFAAEQPRIADFVPVRHAYLSLLGAVSSRYVQSKSVPRYSFSTSAWVSLFLEVWHLTKAAEFQGDRDRAKRLEAEQRLEAAISASVAVGAEYITMCLGELSHAMKDGDRARPGALLREVWRHLSVLSTLESLVLGRAADRHALLEALGGDGASLQHVLAKRVGRAGSFLSFLNAVVRSGASVPSVLRTIGALFGLQDAKRTAEAFVCAESALAPSQVIELLRESSLPSDANSLRTQLGVPMELFSTSDAPPSLYLKVLDVARVTASIHDVHEGDLSLLFEPVQMVDVMAYNVNGLKSAIASYQATRSDAALSDVKRALDRLLDVPVVPSLYRYRDMVREVSSKLTKRVEFRVTGDSTIAVRRDHLYLLQDALVHLLRNALDHGLETPEERLRAGKPETGLLHVDCALDTNSIRISIADDGRGIDEKAVRRKAVELGLITEEKAEKLTPIEAVNLVFLPHFSTAKTVSDISGRGIGMDVVRSNVAKVGGDIHISSTLGHGTEFVLSIPS